MLSKYIYILSKFDPVQCFATLFRCRSIRPIHFIKGATSPSAWVKSCKSCAMRWLAEIECQVNLAGHCTDKNMCKECSISARIYHFLFLPSCPLSLHRSVVESTTMRSQIQIPALPGGAAKAGDMTIVVARMINPKISFCSLSNSPLSLYLSESLYLFVYLF